MHRVSRGGRRLTILAVAEAGGIFGADRVFNASPRAPGPSSAKPRRAYGSGGREGTGGAATLGLPQRGTPSPRGSYRPYWSINVIAQAIAQS